MARRVRSLSALPDIAARSMRFCSSGFRLSADLPPIRQPLTTIYPDVGWEKPQMQRISVVLPQPFAPTRP